MAREAGEEAASKVAREGGDAADVKRFDVKRFDVKRFERRSIELGETNDAPRVVRPAARLFVI